MNDLINKRAVSLGIRARLFIGFFIITALFMSAIGVTLYVVNNTKQLISQVVLVDYPAYNKLRDYGISIYQIQIYLQILLSTNDLTVKQKLDSQWSTNQQIESDLDVHYNSLGNKDTLQKWNEVKGLVNQLKKTQSKFVTTLANSAMVASHIKEIDVLVDNILTVLDGPLNADGQRNGGIYEQESDKFNRGTSHILADMNNVQFTEYAITIIGLIAAILITIITAKNIIRHINVFRAFSSKIASRDLRQQLSIESGDEIGQLGNDLNTMTESLANITKQITTASQNMVTTLAEVKQAVDVQSSGASEQASSINQITASLEEIEKSSSQTMEKAKMLGEAAERTRERGQLGLEAVEQSIAGMKTVKDKVQMIAQTILDLSNKTQQVGEITAVVNTLAQQSKMLALNASIEAAKAGEAGKGFAVVASEVKNLAEQSEQSTSQVQKILEDIRHATEKAVMVTEEGTKGVDQGTSLVEQTGDIVKNLSDVIHETTVASQQIEAAVRQEGVGIEQITAGMNEINQVTATFVASAQQTTEAISNLTTIAKQLKEHVETYKV